MDSYRSGNSIVLWVKTPEGNSRVVRDFSSVIYADASRRLAVFLERNGISYSMVQKRTYLGEWKDVFAITVPHLSGFEAFVRWVERSTHYRIPLYNADIPPEQMFLYENNLVPFTPGSFPLSRAEISVKAEKLIILIVMNGREFTGPERELLTSFAEEFEKLDPDVVLMDYAFSQIPFIASRFEFYGISCPFNRWDALPIRYKGGKSYYTYGQVRYQDFAVRLNGRFLVDSTTAVGSACDVDAIVELCQLSGSRFQQVASRSFGAVFQGAVVREMVRRGILVPFKEKPLDRPVSWFELLKSDRAGHTLDPKIGFHEGVAEVDFSSMFPWIIHNRNISADTILCGKGPFASVPGVPVRISLSKKGIIPVAILPFLERRMEYKRKPSAVNRARAIGLKWVLVTCYGYLRFREFKLGIGSSHMAVCSYARETLLAAVKLAEGHGFEVVHGIVDSLYIKKKNISEDGVRAYCRELELLTGIPVSFGGIFKWIVFLPSVSDSERPVPARYYGAFRGGGIKARGIEVRQRSAPLVVKVFQQKILEIFSSLSSRKEIISEVKVAGRLLHSTIHSLSKLDPKWLECVVRLGKSDYRRSIPQRVVVLALRKKGVHVKPGQLVRFVFQHGKVVLPEVYNGRPDIVVYRRLLVRSFFVLLQPFGFSREDVLSMSGCSRQTKISEYDNEHWIRHVYIPAPSSFVSSHGSAEKNVRKRLERQGYEVWRGGMINVVRLDDIYPNVRRRYSWLCSLLEKYHPGILPLLQYMCAVHHGMPDFICFRQGRFKFVECKLSYERLSERQKMCILRLGKLGFQVEVHKLVYAPTKVRQAVVNISTQQASIIGRQLPLKTF